MKTLLSAGTALGLLALSTFGIPQTFQQNQFLVRTSITFEQFATDPDAWGDAATLKGRWEAHGDTLTLTDSAAVFGIPADQVTAQQQNGRVQSFRVIFRTKDKHAVGKPVDLLTQVTANVRAFTGEAGLNVSSGTTVFKYKSVTITLRSSSGHEVVAEFTRA